MLLVPSGSYCSLFWVAVLLPDGELVLCSVLCSIPIYSFICDGRGFLCCCSAEWEGSIPLKKVFVRSATGVLYLSCIRSHLPPLSVLLCSLLVAESNIALPSGVSVSAVAQLLAQPKEIFLCREKGKSSHCYTHVAYSRLSTSILWSCCTFVCCLCWHTGISVFSYMGEKSCCLGT